MSWPRVALPLYWVALAAATHYPSVPMPDRVEHGDKIVHFSAFALLAWLFWYFLASWRAPTSRSAWLAAAVLVPYSAVDEFTQQLVGRNSDIADWIANVAGITFALAVLEIRRRYWRRARA